ncbi:MAG TPA: M56 family metallopeptidase [Clostridia bacterium]|nr:M56 family metallopeptidase [Clostridia bacterium]
MNALLVLTTAAFECIWRTSFIVAILAVLVFLTQKLLGRWLTPYPRYVLSLLIFIRLMLPMAPSSRMSLENLFWPLPKHHALSVVAPAPRDQQVRPVRLSGHLPYAAPRERIESTLIDSGRDSVSLASTLSTREVMSLVWAGGCLCLVALAWWRYVRWKRLILRGQAITNPNLLALLDDARVAMGVRRPVKLVSMPGLNSPAVFGLRRVCLLLPQSATTKLSGQELRMVFLHEMAHIRRHDLELNVLFIGVQFLHWFNPLVWLASHRIRADGELVCDRMVMNRLLVAERSNYGQLLLKLIGEFQTPALSGAIPVVGSKQEIKRRLLMIKNSRVGSFRATLVAALSVVALVGTTFTHAQNVVKVGSGDKTESSSANRSSDVNAGLAGQTSPLARDLMGTWVLVGQPGKIGKAPASGGRYKFFTGSHWCISQADPENHVVIFHHGGTYLFDGKEYVETLQYANPTTMDRIGRTNHYEIRIEGDTLTQTGIGNPWREVWKRIGTKSGSISASRLGQGLIGVWTLSDEPNAFKFITDSSWCDTTADSKTGVVVFHHGGGFTMKGNRYVQNVEYANPGSMNLIGHSFKFDVSVDGDTLKVVGVKNPWTQSWNRVR